MTFDQRTDAFRIAAPITTKALLQRAVMATDPSQAAAKALDFEAAEQLLRALRIIEKFAPPRPLAVVE